jgi:predicted membrane protein
MKKHLLPLALILLIALLFAPLVRTFVREVLVIPFLYLFWLVRFLLEFLPQASLWPVFVLMIFLILATAFLSRSARPRRVRPLASPEPGRVAGWRHLLGQARADSYYKWRLGQQMQKLALEAIAQQKGQSIKLTRQQLRNGSLNLPADLQAYFDASLQSLGQLSGGSRLAFWRRGSHSPALDLPPERIILFLENLDNEEL